MHKQEQNLAVTKVVITGRKRNYVGKESISYFQGYMKQNAFIRTINKAVTNELIAVLKLKLLTYFNECVNILTMLILYFSVTEFI